MHSNVTAVIRDAANVAEAEATLEVMLDPFSEHLDMEPYVEWITPDEVERASQIYRDNPEYCGEGGGPEKPFDEYVTEGNLEAWNEWTRQAVGAMCAGNRDEGRHDDEKDQFGYMSTYNPRSRWDYWDVGGRWHGFFLLKSGVGSDSTRGFEDGRADLARKGDIDFEMTRVQAQIRAEESFDRFEKATAGIEPVERFEDLAKRHFFDAGIDPDGWQDFRTDLEDVQERRNLFNAPLNAARDEYHKHPWVVALREENLLGFSSNPHEDFFVGVSDARQKFVAEQCNSVLTTHALLLDGEWYEQGRMGWFGMVANVKDPSLWDREFNRKIDSLPDDVYLAVVDVHI